MTPQPAEAPVFAKVFADRASARAVKKQIVLAGSKTAYWFYSSKQPNAQDLVLVHGYRGTHAGLEAIAGLLTDFNLYIPDLPGFGESDTLQPETTLEGYAGWLCAFIAEVCPKANVVAHSYGTLIAGIAAARDQLANRVIVLINPIGQVERRAISKFEGLVASTLLSNR